MLLLHSFPDLSASSSEPVQAFRAKWGRENCIAWGRSRHAEFGPSTHTLSIRAAWDGTEYCHVNGRALAVDDDNFLILNHGRIYATAIHARRPVEFLAICFRPGLAEQIYADRAASIEHALARGESVGERTAEFIENLQPHDRIVSPVLRFIKSHLAQGLDDEHWYEEQLIFLLERMQIHHSRMLEQVERLPLARVATRREVFRRIGLATDFLHASYAKNWSLEELARVAYLSKYHFLRLFTLVHGATPFDYLQRKRARVALRLLQSTKLPVDEVASSVGLATRSALLRQMRRWTGFAPTQLRKQAA